MDDNNEQINRPLTKKEKAQQAGKDVAEVAAKGAGRYYGGPVGGAAVDAALNTKLGQKAAQSAGKNLARKPMMRSILARNQQNIHHSKPILNSLMGSIGNNSAHDLDTSNEFLDDEVASESTSSGKGIISGIFNKLPFKYKVIFIGVIASFVMLVVFLVVLITPLIELGIIDISSSGGSGGSGGVSPPNYSDVSDNINHWWPIGSSETTTINGVIMAAGSPYVTTITSYYSSREEFRNDAHNGLDVGNGGNGPGVVNVIASKSGTVTYPKNASQTSYSDNGYYGNPDGGGFGNYVAIKHSDGTITVYAHLAKDSITVMNGDTVTQGQVIGKMGHSGSSTGTHLHFEVRVNGNRVDPLNYVSNTNTRP